MRRDTTWGWFGVVVVLAGCAAVTTRGSPSASQPQIPRTWADSAIATFEVPLATPDYSPQHVSEEYYYALPERVIWKTYPIYHPDREPPGYRDSLALVEPEVVFDASALVSDQDWIEAGALVFRAPIAYDGAVRPRDVVDPTWYEENRLDLTSDGVFPWARWVIREKGKLEVTNLSCAMCHTRLMPDGSLIEGAQGNFPFEWVTAWRIRQGDTPAPVVRGLSQMIAGAPWIDDPLRDPRHIRQMPLEELADLRAAIPPGVLARQGTSLDTPARIPDLIGIRDRKYLDATGLVVHRDIGDVMRYAAVNQTMDVLARYGDYVPATGTTERPPPGAARSPGAADRYSDAQLYALALYLYSLEPPPNPHPVDDVARRGAEVFKAEGCGSCHTPPLYTNNRLVPVPGFDPPDEHYERYDVSERRVNTDPGLAITTRRGTGYYKVPSLKGVWYRGPLQHSGAIATLEDWFDRNRLRDGYVPTGFRGRDGDARPVVGHPIGLSLSGEDREALIAYLRTL
jgi:mono/diheme cytochrome c family protein